MPTLRTLTIAPCWFAIAAAAACGSAPDTPVSPVVSDRAIALFGTTCTPKTTIALAVGAAKRLTDAEAACLNFKSIQGSRYLLAYVDTRVVEKAKQQAEWPWPDSAIVKVEDVSSGGRAFPTIVPTGVHSAALRPTAQHGVADGASALMVPSTCPQLNVLYPYCRTRPYVRGEVITHYPNDGRPASKAQILTIVGNLAVAVFEPDADTLGPNARARTDSALVGIVKRNIPLMQKTFSLANPTTTSDESGQLYIALQAANVSSAAAWPDAVNGNGRWARVTLALRSGSGFGNNSLSYTNALQVLGHETMHTYQYRWRYEHASPWLGQVATTWAFEGGATFIAQELVRDQLGIAFNGNTVFAASGLQDPTFPLGTYNFPVRNFISGYGDAASMLRDFVQRLVSAGMPFDDAMSLVLVGAMEGWYGINEENQKHGVGLVGRMQKVFGPGWNPTSALLLWTMSEAADDLTTNSTYQNFTKRAPNPSTATNNIRPDALIRPGSSVSVSRPAGNTGVFEIDASVGATYRATSNFIRNSESPIEWLLLRIQ